MVYNPQTWLDGKSGGTPISAARLNYIEQGLADARTVETFTTTQRNALTAGQKWEGRVIYNSTTDRLQQWDGAAWQDVPIGTDIPALATTGTPLADAVAAARGTASSAARSDHVHPSAPWVDYTPVWTSTAGVPAIGNGLLQGRHQLIGRTCHFEMALVVGSTTTFGNAGGQWRFTLPKPAFYGFSYSKPLGNAVLLDSGARQYEALAIPVGGSSTLFYLWSDRGASETSVTPSTPYTWAVNDVIGVSGTYEAIVP